MCRPSLVALALAFACALPAMPASAASSRTAVSGLGNDANPCTLAQPCRTLQGAFNATVNGGEIEVLDPAGYGSLTITHAVTIEGHGWASMNTAANGTAITINAGTSDNVSLRGLVVEGFGTAANGVVFNSGGAFHLEDSVIRGFTVLGIGVNAAIASISAVRVTDCADGIHTTGAASVTIVGSALFNNSGHALFAESSLTVIRSSTVAFNFFAIGTSTKVGVGQSLITANSIALGLINTGAAEVLSLGGNSLFGNSSTDPFTSTIAQQ